MKSFTSIAFFLALLNSTFAHSYSTATCEKVVTSIDGQYTVLTLEEYDSAGLDTEIKKLPYLRVQSSYAVDANGISNNTKVALNHAAIKSVFPFGQSDTTRHYIVNFALKVFDAKNKIIEKEVSVLCDERDGEDF